MYFSRTEPFHFSEPRPNTTDFAGGGSAMAVDPVDSSAGGAGRPRKLAPIPNRPSVEEARIRIDDRKKSNTHGLHLSVNFSGGSKWRQQQQQSLDPLEQQQQQALPSLAKRNSLSSLGTGLLRKDTYVVGESEESGANEEKEKNAVAMDESASIQG